MTAADILEGLLRVNLAAGAAILGVVALRKAARARFGARVAYGLWLLPALAGAAVLIPARQIVVVRSAVPALGLVRATRVHHTLAMAPTVAATAHLDPLVALIGLWLLGVAGVALIMAHLQHRFTSQARAGAIGPAVVGVIAPRIVTPKNFAERYNPDEQALVLAHEQAHLARQDSRVNGLCASVQCLFWFNALVHLAVHLMRIDQELACDEAVVARFPSARRAYAEVLMKAQLAILPLPLGCYWPSKAQHPLVERVAMLKHKDISRAQRLTGAATLAILCAGAGVGAWAAQPADVRVTVRPAAASADDRDRIEVAANPPPAPADAINKSVLVRTIRIKGAGRVGDDAVLAVLAITPGQTVTGAEILAAAKRLMRTGWFTQAMIGPPKGALPQDGDLIVRVTEKPSIEDRPPLTPISSAETAPQVAWLPRPTSTPPTDIFADMAAPDDAQHLTVYSGDVQVSTGDNYLTSDKLTVYTFATGPRAEPAASRIRQMIAEGHVTYVATDETAQADQAVYDPASDALTLSGNAVIVQGKDEVRGDRLVLDVKTKAVTKPSQN